MGSEDLAKEEARLLCKGCLAVALASLVFKQMRFSKQTKGSGESLSQLRYCHTDMRTRCQIPSTYVKCQVKWFMFLSTGEVEKGGSLGFDNKAIEQDL